MDKISRRNFLSGCGAGLAGPAGPLESAARASEQSSKSVGDVHIFKGDAPDSLWKFSREAFLYEKTGSGKTVCNVCPNHCMLSNGDRSICRSKVNIDGNLHTLAYGNPCSVHVDPVEKKPLFHFMPQSSAFSMAATGCSFRCLNCQNWEISQVRPEDVRTYELFPEQAAERAQRAGA
ncbi:MAG: radical SAM protein, partial [Desulfosalsimonas sp.]